MSAERLHVYIDEMTQVAAETVQFVKGMAKDDFLKDIVRQRAVGMNLLMIGETVVHLLDEYPEFAADFSDIPWNEKQNCPRLHDHQSRHCLGHNAKRHPGASGEVVSPSKLACPR